MKKTYNPEKIEKHVQKIWKKHNIFHINNNNDEKNFYCLSMFPYPSGKLHIGHIRNYTIGDVIARYKKLEGFNVLNPIGWDSFGIPAENAAYKNNISPHLWIDNNIKCMKNQLKKLGFGFDWDREITTSHKDYYKWEQLFFIKLYKSNLIYKKNSFINWDPVDKTVLANEQVIDGKGWRSNVEIERKKIPQWYLRISDYADELLNGLKYLNKWPIKVKEMQKNWINKKTGYEICFNIYKTNKKLNLFIENLDMLKLLKFVLISNEHELINENITTETVLIHPLNKKKLPLRVTNKDYQYTTDYLCDIGITDHIESEQKKNTNVFKNILSNYNIILTLKILKDKIKKVHVYNLKDWCISRQRYWGAPIPIVYCEKCGVNTEDEKKLPVILPKIEQSAYKNISLHTVQDFVNTSCPTCKGNAKREIDTFDTFFESSWYYAKYICYNSNFNANLLNKWLPVDQYIGGIEHATLHLIYARFFHKLMKDFNIVKCQEPFINLLTQGMVLMDGSKMSKSKGNIIDQELLIKAYGADTLRLFILFSAPPDVSFEWKENGIKGCRKFLEKIWTLTHKINNIQINNFLAFETINFDLNQIKIITDFNKLLEKIYFNINETRSFNVVIALLMTMLNLSEKLMSHEKSNYVILQKFIDIILILLSPISPHITHYLWSDILKKKTFILNETLPEKLKNKGLDNSTFDLAIHINNKFKTNITFNKKDNKKDIIEAVMQNDMIKNHLLNYSIKNIIYKEFKILNIIINNTQ